MNQVIPVIAFDGDRELLLTEQEIKQEESPEKVLTLLAGTMVYRDLMMNNPEFKHKSDPNTVVLLTRGYRVLTQRLMEQIGLVPALNKVAAIQMNINQLNSEA